MLRKIKHILTCLTALLLAHSLAANERVDPVLKEEVRGVIYHGGDFPSQESINKADKLSAMGERAYPALGEILLETTNPLEVANLLSVVENGPGNKTVIRPYLLTFIERVETGTELKGSDGAIPSELNMPAIIKLLGQAGTAEDIPLLFRYLNGADKKMHYSAFLSLSKLGDQVAARQLSAWTETELQSAGKENELYYLNTRTKFEKALIDMRARLDAETRGK